MSWLNAPASETQITHGKRLWLYICSGLVMTYLVLPSLIVVPMSFSGSAYLEFPPEVWSLRWYYTYFNSLAWQNATVTSLTVAVLTFLLATPMGTLAAYGLHVSRFRFSMYIYVVLSLPLMVPVIMIAIGVFFLYAKLGTQYCPASDQPVIPQTEDAILEAVRAQLKKGSIHILAPIVRGRKGFQDRKSVV